MDEDSKLLAVVVQRLDDLREDFQGLRNEVTASRQDVVGRGEWLQRNALSDSRFEAQGREISEIKQAMAAARAPWWSWLGPVVAMVAVLWTIVGPSILAAG